MSTFDFVDAWRRVTIDIERRRVDLNELDRIAGDGDHGENLVRGYRAALVDLDETAPTGVANALERVGGVIMDRVAGSSGFLLGSAFRDAGRVLKDRELLDARAIGDAIDAAVTVIARRGKASAGDKTMLDALIPARDAVRALAPTATATSAMARAAEAASEGAKSTAAMIASKGRASYVGERGRGFQDAGATSVALTIAAIAEALGADTDERN